MWIKYLIIKDRMVAGIKYHSERGDVVLGGNIIFIELMRNILKNYFKLIARRKNIGYVKTKYVFTSTENKFFDVIKKLREDDYQLKVVSTFDDLFRNTGKEHFIDQEL